MRRHKILLYNPKAVFYTMPLALLALGSYLDAERYDVRVVDGRLERDPVAALLAEVDDALCLGVTVLTGAPIRDALRVTAAARARRPDLPIVWGGWHPSLFPEQSLLEAGVDAVVVGQGEESFAEIVERLAAGDWLDGVAGCHYRPRGASLGSPHPPTPSPVATGEGGYPPQRVSRSVGGEGQRLAGGAVQSGPPRVLRDINRYPPMNYGLVDVERYFALKGQRQLDYISSQGCRFRCSFCADPFVYKRGWYGLEPARMAEELERLWRRYRFDDVGFQDETFFTNAGRVAAIAEEFQSRGLGFRWMATMRADQGARLDEAVLAEARRAGLRRVMIGLESGAQPMLDWMKKDIKLEQVFESAEKCGRQDIAVLFNIIVGFPDERPEYLAETLRVAKRLRAMGPGFEIAIFYYKPYPGNEIADMLQRQGYAFPRTLEEWAEFDYVGSSGPWLDAPTRTKIERFKFYQRIGWARPSPLRAPLQALARWRCRRDLYAAPLEKVLVEWLRPGARLS